MLGPIQATLNIKAKGFLLKCEVNVMAFFHSPPHPHKILLRLPIVKILGMAHEVSQPVTFIGITLH